MALIVLIVGLPFEKTDFHLALATKCNTVSAVRAVLTQAQADGQRYGTLVKNRLAATQPRYEQAKEAMNMATADRQ